VTPTTEEHTKLVVVRTRQGQRVKGHPALVAPLLSSLDEDLAVTPPFSPVCSPRVRLPGLGLQARVEPGLPADPAVALHPGAAEERGVPRRHRLAGRLRRVRHQGPGRGGPALGGPQVQTADELRQAQPSSQVRMEQKDTLLLYVTHVKWALHRNQASHSTFQSPI